MKDFGIQAKIILQPVSNDSSISAEISAGTSAGIDSPKFNQDGQLNKKAKPS